MKVKIIDHKEIKNGIKEITIVNIHTKEKLQMVLTGESYSNFVKYVMYLWSNDLCSYDVITKVVKNKDCYCFYKA